MALDPISAAARLEMILDAGTMTELNAELIAGDPLVFPGYGEKIAAQREKTGMREALVSAEGCIEGMKAVVCVLDGGFFMGSMGTAVGEKVTLAVEYAKDNRLPLIIFSASGGARMQEGILSLMQMAKTSAAVERFQQAGGLFISVLTVGANSMQIALNVPTSIVNVIQSLIIVFILIMPGIEKNIRARREKAAQGKEA